MESANGGGQVAASRLERLSAPRVPAGDLAQLVAGNTAFAFDLYSQAVSGADNHIFSPYNISLAFVMAYGGARGDTASQMADVLHYLLAGEQLHPAFNALDQDLAARPGELLHVEAGDRFKLIVANAIWGQEGWSFLPEYLDLLAANYGAGMRLVDFEQDPEAARRMINDWVSKRTDGRIRDIIPPGSPNPETRLALANASYFKAAWLHSFDQGNTKQASFTLLDGRHVPVDMMKQAHGENFAYAAGEGWQAVTLPYIGGVMEMLLIIPDEGNFGVFEAHLAAEKLDAVISAMEPHRVLLSMPRFTFESSYELVGMLAELGMLNALDPEKADFSGIDGTNGLYISNALHKAFIAVDEKGTEAAAATAIVMRAGIAMHMDEIELTIDRPFCYIIRDVPTGTILFMGRVLDPR